MRQVLFSVLAMLLLQGFAIDKNNGGHKVEIINSNIVWKGYKVTGSHKGNLSLKSGTMNFEDELLVGGEFVIDMTSLKCTDLSGEYKENLEGHLKSGDFFDVAKFPTSNLRLIKVDKEGKNSYEVTADLTIKGITNSIVFEASVYGQKATANIKIDRTKFDVKYGSGSFFDGLKDNMIYDEFDLVIDLEY